MQKSMESRTRIATDGFQVLVSSLHAKITDFAGRGKPEGEYFAWSGYQVWEPSRMSGVHLDSCQELRGFNVEG